MHFQNQEIKEFAAMLFDMRGPGALKHAFDTCAYLLRAGERDEALQWFEIGEAIVRLEGESQSPQQVATHKSSWTLH